MSWDPNTALVPYQPRTLALYQPVDFYEAASKHIFENQERAFEKFEKELNALSARSREEIFNKKLHKTIESIETIIRNFSWATKGDKEEMDVEVKLLYTTMLTRLVKVITSYKEITRVEPNFPSPADLFPNERKKKSSHFFP